MKTEKSAATLTIKDAGKMTTQGRKDLVAWLRRQVSYFLKYGEKYTDGRFTARYLYR